MIKSQSNTTSDHDWQCGYLYHLMRKVMAAGLWREGVMRTTNISNTPLKVVILKTYSFTDIVCLVPGSIGQLKWLIPLVLEISLYHDVQLAEVSGFQDKIRPSGISLLSKQFPMIRCLNRHEKVKLNLIAIDMLKSVKVSH